VNDAEWYSVVERLAENWPHQLQPDSSLEKFRKDLGDFPVDQVLAAVETLYRDGREFPPNSGQIRARIADLHFDAPPFYEALRVLRRALTRGSDYIVEDDSEKGWRYEDRRITYLEEHAPLLLAFVRSIGIDRIELTDGGDEARLRNKYDDFIRRAREHLIYGGLAPAGLRKLERVLDGELVESNPHAKLEPRKVALPGGGVRRVEREEPSGRRMGFAAIAERSRAE
jgi:hypothetical protein